MQVLLKYFLIWRKKNNYKQKKQILTYRKIQQESHVLSQPILSLWDRNNFVKSKLKQINHIKNEHETYHEDKFQINQMLLKKLNITSLKKIWKQ
jgi:hypothetical protein